MTKYVRPILTILWPHSSPPVANVGGEFTGRFSMEDHSIFLPTELAAATGAEIREGHFHSFTGLPVRLFEWRDPLEEHDLLMITCEPPTPGSITQECRDILNLVCPPNIDKVVTFAGRASSHSTSSEYSASVTAARHCDLSGLNPKLNVFQEGSLVGPEGVLLGMASELDLPGFCIVVDFDVDTGFVSPQATRQMFDAFSLLTGIDLSRGKLSKQAIRMQKHIKSMVSKNNANDPGQPAESCESVEDQFRHAENIAMIEQMFTEAKADKSLANHLKAELDRLGLYDQYEDTFLDLFRS